MKNRLGIVLVIVAVLQTAGPCWAQEHARQFLASMQAYKAGDYAEAARQLQAIAADGVQNGQLYYDLGNAYLKSNDLGRAILWYERALKLLPEDPDLRFNYDYARSLTKDVPDETASPLVHILFFWKYQLSTRTVIGLALAFNLLFWGLAAAGRLMRRRGLRLAAVGVFIPAAVLILTASYNYYETAHGTQAIVLPEKIAVRSGLESTSTELFQLHAGAKVKVVKEMKGHVQIRFSQDKIGWIESGAVGRV
jgi:tetratricopeptide (TPR) repeat protein